MPKFMDVIQYEEIDHPSHYNPEGIEAIDVIEDWNHGYHLSCVIKYICRYDRKPGPNPLNDLRKAQWYLNRYIEKAEPALKPESPVGTGEPLTDKEILDRDFMLSTMDDLWKFVVSKVALGPVGRTYLSKLRAKEIAKATTQAFKKAFRIEIAEQRMLDSLALTTEQVLARDKLEKENSSAT